MSKVKTHPSIVKIEKHFKIKATFSFSPTSRYEIVKDVQKNKATGGKVPLKKSNLTFNELTECVNYNVKMKNFLTL